MLKIVGHEIETNQIYFDEKRASWKSKSENRS